MTTSVDVGSWTRGRRGSGWSTGGILSQRRARGQATRRCLTTGRSTIEGWHWSRGLSLHSELLEEKLVGNGVEGGEGYSPLDESLQVAIARAEVTQKVQHQGTVDDGLAEVDALHLAAVFSHGEVPLRELVKLGGEVECPSFPVPEELFLESEPRLSSSIRLVTDDVL
jgi:hypothetical protein